MSRTQTWILIALIAAIVIVVIVKAVQRSAAGAQAAAAAQNQNTLALAALQYKQQQEALYAGEHAGVADWLSGVSGTVQGVGSALSSIDLSGLFNKNKT